MSWRWMGVVGIALCIVPPLDARQLVWGASMTVRGNYISSAKVYFNPDATSEALRGEYLPVYDLLGGGIELRITLPEERIFFSLSADYVARTKTANFLLSVNGVLQRASGSEALKFIPVELAMNTYVPLGAEDFQLSMGGGIGVYYAAQSLTIFGVKTQTTSNPLAYGIHINTGLEYRLNTNIRFRTEMRFRDPEIINENKYEQQTLEGPFRTKIQVNGLSLSFGVIVELF